MQAHLLAVPDARVQVGEVRRVEAALARLRPVALLQLLRHEPVSRRDLGELEPGQFGRGTVSHVRPDHVARFPRLERANRRSRPDPFRRFRSQRGHLQAVALVVELPAVIGAADAAILHPPEKEVRAPMRADRLDDADTAPRVTKGNEVLAEELDALRRTVGLRQFPRQQRGHPVRAEDVPHRSVRPGLGQSRVIFRRKHSGPPATCAVVHRMYTVAA